MNLQASDAAVSGGCGNNVRWSLEWSGSFASGWWGRHSGVEKDFRVFIF